ncbi:hypothetical protein [Piscirickettsia salmonis]|uniref:hypothetical protein n=1 Tax=Piscirickettsia salmonis TaxID=1238 RepID=UPI003A7FBC52
MPVLSYQQIFLDEITDFSESADLNYLISAIRKIFNEENVRGCFARSEWCQRDRDYFLRADESMGLEGVAELFLQASNYTFGSLKPLGTRDKNIFNNFDKERGKFKGVSPYTTPSVI